MLGDTSRPGDSVPGLCQCRPRHYNGEIDMLVECIVHVEQRDCLLGGVYQDGKYGLTIMRPSLVGSGNVRAIATDDDLSFLLREIGLTDPQIDKALKTLNVEREFKIRLHVESTVLQKHGF